ncbi:MAG: hypothetical protein ACTHOO_10790 [Alcanivorax sp.]
MDREIKELSKNAFDFLRSVQPDGSWVSGGEIENTVLKISENLQECVDLAQVKLSEICDQTDDVADNNVKTRDLIVSWHDGKDRFCSPSMIAYVVGAFGFDYEAHRSLIDAMLVASVLAEVNNDMPYHNNLHFRKVLLHLVRMLTIHNRLFKDKVLDQESVAKLVVAACIHDLGHNGGSNIVDRKYHMARLEKASYTLAYPFLAKTGVSEDFLNDILLMLIGTDTAPFGDPISPSSQIKVAYEYHFSIKGQGGLSLSEELMRLERDQQLALLCVILHEADIMNSAGVDYDITKYETVCVSQEYGDIGAYPEDTLLFLEKVCNGGFLTDAGSYLADDNLKTIKGRIMQDFKNGNKSYV